jgi:hypothetical protein
MAVQLALARSFRQVRRGRVIAQRNCQASLAMTNFPLA